MTPMTTIELAIAICIEAVIIGISVWLAWRLFHRWEGCLLVWMIVGYEISILHKLNK